MDWIHLAQAKVKGRAVVKAVAKGGRLLALPGDHELLKKATAVQL
jgi:hypothetical protein